MRLVLTCRKEGDKMFVLVENDISHTLDLPATEDGLNAVYKDLYGHLMSWFTDRVEQYDHGNYGSTDIGFDIQRVGE